MAAGLTVIEAGTCRTVIAVFFRSAPIDAISVVLPTEVAVNVALVSVDCCTATTAGFPLVHVTRAPPIGFPRASATAARMAEVAPSAVISSTLSDTIKVAASGRTTITLRPDATPETAVMVAVPCPTDVTSPALLTEPTAGALELHDTLAPSITRPLASLTEARSNSVSPSEYSPLESGVMRTVAGTGAAGAGLVGVGFDVDPSPPAQPANTTSSNTAEGMRCEWTERSDHSRKAMRMTDSTLTKTRNVDASLLRGSTKIAPH